MNPVASILICVMEISPKTFVETTSQDFTLYIISCDLCLVAITLRAGSSAVREGN